ncbi:MAG: hypothetical protein NUV57_00350 [archaeon]|nr:hypothetical protein [archaeon]
MNKNNSKAIMQVAGIAIGLLLVIGLFSFLVDSVLPSQRQYPMNDELHDGRGFVQLRPEAFEFRETLLFLQIILASINSLLLFYLLYNYMYVYNQVKSKFALGLIVAAIAFLAFTFSANPIVQALFGFRSSGLGPFTILPLVFTLAVTLILIYLSKE